MDIVARVRPRSLFRIFRKLLKTYLLVSATLLVVYCFCNIFAHDEVYTTRLDIRHVDIKVYGSNQENSKTKPNKTGAFESTNDVSGEGEEDYWNSKAADIYTDFENIKSNAYNEDDIIEHNGNVSKQAEQGSVFKEVILKRVKDVFVFYISAFATNSSAQLGKTSFATNSSAKLGKTEYKFWDVVTLNGWLTPKSENYTLFCCFKRNDKTVANKAAKILTWDVPKIRAILASQFVCDNPWHSDVTLLPTSVGLSRDPHCNHVQYKNIDFAMKPAGDGATLAFCGKVIYGTYPADRLIEWFEMNKAMGVDHVALFTYNVTVQTMNVLRHYEKSGYLTLRRFDYPMQLRYPRHLGQKYVLSWVDEQVIVFDCMQRFHGYSYVGIIDVDEFIVPTPKYFSDYKALLKKLSLSNRLAAGFTFHTAIFVLDWGETNPDGQLMVNKYKQRTHTMWDRKKSIVKPSRVVPGSVWTHGFECQDKFKQVNVASPLSVIFHYRRCRPHWIRQGTCLSGRTRIMDNKMLSILPKFRNQVFKTRDALLNNSIDVIH